jgi:NADPH:quinone reductase-like Zn-dependent oxidoreductase
MKAAIFENLGLENLRVDDVTKPELTPHNVLIKVKRETVVSIRNGWIMVNDLKYMH